MQNYEAVPIMDTKQLEKLPSPRTYLVYANNQWHEKFENNRWCRGYRFRTIEENYISDVLAEDFPKWEREDRIYIEAPTGAGKNTFVENVIIKTLQRQNAYMPCKKRVLIISNRIALGRQLKKRIYKLLEHEQELANYTEMGIDKKCKHVECVWMYSYQELAEVLQHTEADFLYQGIFGKAFDYVILDECHFFMRDSNFNPRTDRLLDKILDAYTNSVMVFMTATPEGIFQEIMDREEARKQILSKNALWALQGKRCSQGTLWGYQKNYDRHFEFEFVENLEKIFLDIIKRNFKARKQAIIWVKSKKQGEEIEKKINDSSGGATAVLLTAESKESAEIDGNIYTEIVDTEKFSCDVLISTIVIENGVNIKSSKVMLQLCFLDDYYSIVQCLGRIRNPHPNMKVYFKEYNKRHLENLLRRSEEWVEAIKLHENNPKKFYDYLIKNDVKNLGISSATELLCDGTIHVNKLAVAYKRFQCATIRRILESNVSRPYASEVLHWFSMSLEEKNIAQSSDVMEWKKYLEECEGESILKDQQYEFKKRMTEFSKLIFGRRPQDKVADAIYGMSILNQQILAADLQFEIVSDRRTAVWTVKRKDEEDGEQKNF